MMSSYTLGLLTQTVFLPLAVTVLGLMLGRGLSQRFFPGRSPRFLSGLALAAGFLTGYGLIYTQFSFPPRQALDWLPILVMAALLASALGGEERFLQWLWMLIRTALVFLAAALLLAPVLRQAGGMRGAVTLFTVGFLWIGAWFYLDRIARHGAAAGIVLLVIAGGNAVVAALTGSVMLGQLGGALAAVLGGWLLLNWPRPRVPLLRAGTAVAVMALGALMLAGRFYADTSGLAALLLLAVFGTGDGALAVASRRGLSPAITAVWVTIAALPPFAAAAAVVAYHYWN